MLAFDERTGHVALVVGIKLDHLGVQAQIKIGLFSVIAEELGKIRSHEDAARRSVHASCRGTAAAADVREHGSSIGKPLDRIS